MIYSLLNECIFFGFSMANVPLALPIFLLLFLWARNKSTLLVLSIGRFVTLPVL